LCGWWKWRRCSLRRRKQQTANKMADASIVSVAGVPVCLKLGPVRAGGGVRGGAVHKTIYAARATRSETRREGERRAACGAQAMDCDTGHC